MAVLVVQSGAMIGLDPSDKRVFVFDWEANNLPVGVEITSSTWTITRLRGAATPMLQKDSEAIVTGNRKTQLRLFTPALHAIYQVDNTIVTNESPAQTKEQHFKIVGRTK